MATQTTLGVKFYIGPQDTSASDTTAYGLLSYTEVGEIEDMGEFGDTFNPVTFTSLADGRQVSTKGTVDGGTLNITVGLDPDDSGQTALIAARDVTSASLQQYAFKVELNDSLGTNPTTYYFRGKVFSYTQNVGSSDATITSTVNVSVDTPVVTLAKS